MECRDVLEGIEMSHFGATLCKGGLVCCVDMGNGYCRYEEGFC